jgi:heme exporter protein D
MWLAVGLTLLALVALLVLAGAIGSASMLRGFRCEREALVSRAREAGHGTAVRAPGGTLPAPVRRYLDVTGTGPGDRLVSAHLSQRGALRSGADRPWMPFAAEQVYAMEPPGFVWLARASLAPGVGILAQDRYVRNRGNMRIQALGFIRIADARGPEIDQGAGLRFWCEVLAFPEMTRSPHLHWEPIHERRARFTVADQAPALSAEVEFDAAGLPCATHSNRYRDVRGARVLTPWSGTFREWKQCDGRLFPVHWESVWHLERGDLIAVRIEVLSVRTS